jgi:small subunit ribosomal protein S15
MTITPEMKKETVEAYRRQEQDTGSPDVQVALLTRRVETMTEHMQSHPKDYASLRGLRGMVSRRRRLLDYIRRKDPQRYLDLINKLGIRK